MALCNDAWSMEYPELRVKFITGVDFSNHHPILVSLNNNYNHKTPKHFRFESAWILGNNDQDTIKRSWREDKNMYGYLREVKEDIKSWKFNTLYQLLDKKKGLLARLKWIRCSFSMRDNIEGPGKLEMKLSQELCDIVRKEALMWYQSSRARWLACGDQNTRYCHIKTINRRRHNRIIMSKKDRGKWIEDESELKELVNEFNKKLFEIKRAWSSWTQTVTMYLTMATKDILKIGAQVEDEDVQKLFSR